MKKSIEERINEIKKNNSPQITPNFWTRILNKILITGIIFIGGLIYIKLSPENKQYLYKTLYDSNYNFAVTNKEIHKYIGDIIPFQNLFKDTTPVFNEKLTYKEINIYQDGAVLTVNDNYLIPVIESGIIVFIGEKEGYGNTVIIQQVNGIDVWYGNITNINSKLYEYMEKGSALGEVKENKLYIAFQKDGKFLNYKDYLE